MKRLLTPTLQISFALTSLTISLTLIASSFGLLPEEGRAAREARAAISESLAIQLAVLASRNDVEAIGETIGVVVKRSPELLSIGLRGADGKLLADSGRHDAHWRGRADGRSNETFVQVPLAQGETSLGQIEIAFKEIASNAFVAGIPDGVLRFLGYIAATGFAGYYLILKRALRELDPDGAVPERVTAAFDALAEGVLITDENEFVLLENDAFKTLRGASAAASGWKIGDMPWTSDSSSADVKRFPWRIAMKNRAPVLGTPMSLLDGAGVRHQLIANATPILDDRGNLRGVITTFDDVTALHETNEQLRISVEQLEASSVTIAEQNKRLQLLATTDPLTGSLNRRTFFEEFKKMLEGADSKTQLSFIMVDLDHFKSINDRFGHAVGDRVLVGVVEILQLSRPEGALVGRYGGEEFCMAVPDKSQIEVELFAEHIRQAVACAVNLLPNGEPVTLSMGIASLSGPCEMEELVNRADEALYAAKRTGRNRFVNWAKLQEAQAATSSRRIGAET